MKAFSSNDFGSRSNRTAYEVKKINLIVRNPIYIISLLSLEVLALQSNPGFPLVTHFLRHRSLFFKQSARLDFQVAANEVLLEAVALDDVLLAVFLINAAGLQTQVLNL